MILPFSLRVSGADPAVLVIGAGPYGLSIAYELHCRGLRPVVYGEPFNLWFSHAFSSAALRSDLRTSEIYARDRRFSFSGYLRRTFGAGGAARWAKQRIPVEIYRGYLRDVLERFPVPIRREKITLLREQAGRFEMETETGDRGVFSNCVLACGLAAHQHLPAPLDLFSSHRVLHAWRAAEIERLRNEKLLVIGSGQSAGEAVAILRTGNQVTWASRRDPVFYADPIQLPRPVFRAALGASSWFGYVPQSMRTALAGKFGGSTMTPDLREAVQAHDVQRLHADAATLQLRQRREGIYSHKTEQLFDRVIACTGYRVDLAKLDFLDSHLVLAIRSEDGCPALDRAFQTRLPGLYAAGAMAEPKHGPAQRFMMGSRHAARAIGASIARRMRARTRPRTESLDP